MLRCRADNTFFHAFDASTATIDGNHEDALFLASCLERGIAARSGRFVDRVDDIDVGCLLENIFHCLAAAFFGTGRHVGADDLWAVAHGEFLRVLRRDAKAREKAVMAQVIDGRLVGREIQSCDFGRFRLVAESCLGPLSNQQPCLEIVGGERGVSSRDRIKRRVERDYQKAGLAGFFDSGHDGGGITGNQHEALGPGGDQGFDRGDLPVVVAIRLAGIGLKLDTQFLGFGVSALLHLDEKRIGVGLGDQADQNVGGHDRRDRESCRDDCDGSQKLKFFHEVPPGMIFANA